MSIKLVWTRYGPERTTTWSTHNIHTSLHEYMLHFKQMHMELGAPKDRKDRINGASK